MTPEQIKSLRLSMPKTQAQFARLFSVTVTTVSRWEAGKSKPHEVHRVKFVELSQEK